MPEEGNGFSETLQLAADAFLDGTLTRARETLTDS
jgi:hypothetical protein